LTPNRNTQRGASSEERPTYDRGYEHGWIDLGGVKAHYIHAGAGEPLVLVHGQLPWCSSEATYGDVVAPLGRHFKTFAVDVVGFGYTTPRGPEDYSGKAQAEFVIRFIEALNVGPVHLAGNSHGGFLTQYVAHERPDLVKKLVISNSLNGTALIPSENYTFASERRHYKSQTVEQIRAMLAGYYQHKDLVTEERVRLVHDIYQRNYEYAQKRGVAVGGSIDAFNENLSYKGKHISEWGGQLKIPVLLMWSEPGSRVEWGVSHFFRVPGAEMHILPWSGHHLFTDQRDRWVQVVTDWLKHPSARPPS
jgi:pimeloyl-ACP methyl ester carboxylesterase